MAFWEACGYRVDERIVRHVRNLGKDAMIFRLSEKLKARIKAGALANLPLDDNPFADWSAGLFLVGRSPYILLWLSAKGARRDDERCRPRGLNRPG
jgi:hypothetical protein